VLVVSPIGLHALDLATLGYQVVLTGARAEPLAHPHLQVADDLAALPFPDGSFDLAVSFCGEGDHTSGTGLAGSGLERTRRAVARALASGGRVIGSYPVADAVPSEDELAELLAPLQVDEVAYASRSGHGWSLSSDAVPTAEVVLYVATAG
jgi:SAM-dependent methyltransferase